MYPRSSPAVSAARGRMYGPTDSNDATLRRHTRQGNLSPQGSVTRLHSLLPPVPRRTESQWRERALCSCPAVCHGVLPSVIASLLGCSWAELAYRSTVRASGGSSRMAICARRRLPWSRSIWTSPLPVSTTPVMPVVICLALDCVRVRRNSLGARVAPSWHRSAVALLRRASASP